MSKHTYFADLENVKFFTGDNGQPMSWVHALPGGKYQHPVYGELDFTDAKILRYSESVNTRVRGIDPDVDYDHKQDPAMGNKAAGWIKQAESRPGSDGKDLWVLVEWTPAGHAAVKNKEYRYYSSELADEWTDAKGNKHEDVVLGGGVTNRPYMKNLVPLNLSELSFKDSPQKANEGEQVDPKELRRKLGLAEDAPQRDVDAKLARLAELGDPKPPSNSDPNLDALTKLAEGNPLIKSFMEQMEATNKALKEANERAQLAETTRKLGELTGPGTKVQLSAAVLNEVMSLLVGAPQQFSDKMFSILTTIAKGDGIVEMGEKGSSDPSKRDEKAGDKDATAKFNAKIAELQKADPKLSFGDAVEQAARSDRQLYDEYRKASYIKSEG